MDVMIRYSNRSLVLYTLIIDNRGPKYGVQTETFALLLASKSSQPAFGEVSIRVD